MKLQVVVMLVIAYVCSASISVFGQLPLTVYSGETLQAGSSNGYTPVLPFIVNTSSGSTAFEGEYEIVLGPDCSLYPLCSPGTANTFQTLGFDLVDNKTYFVARLVPPKAFAELKKQLDGSFCETISNALLFKYTEKYTEGNLSYQIYDYQRNPMIAQPVVIPELILPKKVGDNFLTIDLKKITSMVGLTENASYYTLEVLNDKNEKFLLRFRYILSN